MSPAMLNVWRDAVSHKRIIEAINIDDGRAEPIDAFETDRRQPSGTARGTEGVRKGGGRRFRLSRGVTIDSGAADNVMPKRLLRGQPIRPSEASRAGVHYVACNNGRIANEGEADLAFRSGEGNEHVWTFQIAEVNKVLAAVLALVDCGHRVTFDRDDRTGADVSFILDKRTGTATKMRRERNVWVVDAWIDEDGAENPGSLFARQE